ncbi:hypothetical protein BY996DRAFT_4586247 [Phakopsora pachyrhizi]|uniref:Uncharacterized protein n=1 Tax=Phakopsora pachyrhizi TaxID=170000 RepID=A0AAV0AUJ9_PHAPC|nr:hypothetical protein BY996DRAFT_4586247 [Phakopsora pachyrhizi]CAH7671743.1 hypothetical protein PPACK8108_LOCUS6558 [Phakopsora pachyrhizi]
MFLCNLAKFDVYQVPKWAHDALKPPREHAFGLKSLDKLSFFETKSDFVHKFCCKDKLLQLEWIRRLYDARTFYLMSQGSSQEDQGSTAMNRLRSTDAPSSRPIGDRGKPGVARSGTLAGQSSLHSRKDKNDHETEQIKLRKAKASNQSQGVSSLSRKPTLINPESLSKFRQGTLLGDLGGHVAAPSNGPTSGGRPVLPPHVMPLSQDKSWSSEEKGAPGLASVTLKARTWEKMGPQERKEYLMEVQNRAKAEGRTLLKFESEGKSDHFSESHGLLRSKTIAVDRKKKAR